MEKKYVWPCLTVIWIALVVGAIMVPLAASTFITAGIIVTVISFFFS